jgi:hypothetical protein
MSVAPLSVSRMMFFLFIFCIFPLRMLPSVKVTHRDSFVSADDGQLKQSPIRATERGRDVIRAVLRIPRRAQKPPFLGKENGVFSSIAPRPSPLPGANIKGYGGKES